MPADNKHNLQYFEAPSMRELFDQMETWQYEQGKRLLSLNVAKDADEFCCIALTNPTEVIIMDGSNSGGAEVTSRNHLGVVGFGS